MTEGVLDGGTEAEEEDGRYGGIGAGTGPTGMRRSKGDLKYRSW